MRYIIETRNLTKSYGKKTVINGLDFKISPGEIYALLGLNGAGKTTTIKMLLGLINPSVGQIRYLDKNFATFKSMVLKRVGSVLENPGFYDNLSVCKNLELITNIVGMHQSNNIDEVLKTVGIHAFKYQKVKYLNASQKQKLALCRALINSPDILILDEPMNGLDPKSINEIRTLLIRLAKEKGVTIFISSHVLAEIEKMADRIGILHEGSLIDVIDVSELHQQRESRIFVTVEKLEEAKKMLETNGFTCMIDSHQLIVFADEHSITTVVEGLVLNQFEVKEIYSKSYSLEDYFLELINPALEKELI